MSNEVRDWHEYHLQMMTEHLSETARELYRQGGGISGRGVSINRCASLPGEKEGDYRPLSSLFLLAVVPAEHAHDPEIQAATQQLGHAISKAVHGIPEAPKEKTFHCHHCGKDKPISEQSQLSGVIRKSCENLFGGPYR